MYESVQKGIERLPRIKVYRDEVRTSKRHTFFYVEFRGNLGSFLLYYQLAALLECTQDTD